MSTSPKAAGPVNLPVPLTRFVGRQAELAEASALLAGNRLLTLTGPGGAGKTRLALRLATVVAEDFPEGAWFIDFSSLSGGEFVWDRVAITLGVKEPGPGRPWAEAIGHHLGSRRALLVLDNCEHVVESAAEVAAGLLAPAPNAKVVATSREPLGVGGEVTWAVPPLSEADAVELFTDRARQAWPQFRLRDDDRKAVLDICQRLDGLPLAIELAAARTRAFDPVYIAAGLRDRFAVLPSGPRTAPRRQATLAASFDWSYELLSDPERALLRQLSVFAGGFDVEAALAVCPAASLELLAAVTDRSLIIVDGRGSRPESRYKMLETVRQFAAEHLDEAEEVELMRTRHRDYYLGLAETAEPQMFGSEHDRWRATLRAELDNFRAALAWSRDRGDAEALCKMVVGLTPSWLMRLAYAEAEVWVGPAASRAPEVPPLLRARLRNVHCLVALLSGRGLVEVPAWANEALDLARNAGDKREEAFALSSIGVMAGLVGGAEAMRPYFEEARSLTSSPGSARGGSRLMLTYLTTFSFIVFRLFQSDSEEARRLADEQLDRAKAGGHSSFLYEAMWTAGVIAVIQGRLADAAPLLETALAGGRETDESLVWKCNFFLAWVALLRGDLAAARSAVDECISGVHGAEGKGGSDQMVEPATRWLTGWIQLADGDSAQARKTLSSAVDVVRSSPLSRYASLPLVVMAEAQLALGAVDNAQASLEEATDLARSGALTWVLGRACLVSAKLRARQGDLPQAESRTHEAVSLAREAGDQLGLVDGLELLARLAAEHGAHWEAVRLWAAADTVRNELGYRLATHRTANEAALARTRESISPDDFARAWAEGAKLSLEEAVAFAARGRGERKRPATGWASLTPSELEVARLVGEHLSNPEIAARLFVSRATVKTHLVHIFTKLGIDSRSQLAAEAVKHGRQPPPSARA
jgi:predicted ATPase/DNA-binding CsgD family transcriptional regulator